jgi:membrane protein YqaA with SNARE-associated domain
MKSLTAKLAQFLALYGGWGLLAISFLDSSILSLPLVNDLLIIHLAARNPERVVLYAMQSTVGSILGAYLTYSIARGGGKYLLRKIPGKKIARAQHWLDRNDFVSVLVASLLPPPAPFKVFLIAAGILRVNPVRLGAALLVGRGARFLVEGYLGARYGMQAEQYLKENLAWASLVVVAVVVVATVVHRRLASRRRREPNPNPPQPKKL